MADEENTEEQGGGKGKLIIFAAIALVLVGVSIGGTLFATGFFSADEEIAEEAVEEELDLPAIYYSLQPKFQTNYRVDGRQRFLQAALTLVTREQDVIDAIELHSPLIKSRIVTLLGQQEFATLHKNEGRETLRQASLEAIQSILNEEIGKPGVENVLFTDFVMQ